MTQGKNTPTIGGSLKARKEIRQGFGEQKGSAGIRTGNSQDDLITALPGRAVKRENSFKQVSN